MGGRPSPPGLSLVWIGVAILLCGIPALAQSQQSALSGAQSGLPDSQGQGASTGGQLPDSQVSGSTISGSIMPGSVSGTVVDRTGAVVAGARVRFAREDQSPGQEALSDDDGQFSFANIAPGPYRITITAQGFTAQTISGTLQAGQTYTVPQIVMEVAAAVTEVQVGLSRTEVAEIAEEQIKLQEKQRVLGVIPNFYVSYVPHAAPLNAKQKFELAWKSTVDPINFAIIGVTAGIQQSQNTFSGYGQGAQGYARRYGASYTDAATSTFLGGAILPALLKQDPRYFYKGSGSGRRRILYAVANAVICKGDNGRWQANYSSVLGSLGSGGISNLYYPAKDRGVGLTFENALFVIGENAASNLFQEFIIPKLTPHLPNREPAKR